jgi:DNA-binding NarL/FixJ family response regulator
MARTLPLGGYPDHAARPESGLGFSLPRPVPQVATIESMPVSVLLVDDDAGFRRLAARLLSPLGLDIVGEAASVAAALEVVMVVRPDAVLVDVGLPDGDGCMLAERLVALTMRPRVVLTSSDPDAVSDADARRLGAAGFIAKGELPDGRIRHLLAGE